MIFNILAYNYSTVQINLPFKNGDTWFYIFMMKREPVCCTN